MKSNKLQFRQMLGVVNMLKIETLNYKVISEKEIELWS
jgi:hypothetical protein